MTKELELHTQFGESIPELHLLSSLTTEQKVEHWQNACLAVESCDEKLDMQYESFQALVSIAFRLPLSSIYAKVDANVLFRILRNMSLSKELEMVRLSGILLKHVLELDPLFWKEIVFLLSTCYQVSIYFFFVCDILIICF